MGRCSTVEAIRDGSDTNQATSSCISPEGNLDSDYRSETCTRFRSVEQRLAVGSIDTNSYALLERSSR